MQATAQRFRLDELCGVNGRSCLVETAGGYAIFQTDQVLADWGARFVIRIRTPSVCCSYGWLAYN
jgi:hypothetical protein